MLPSTGLVLMSALLVSTASAISLDVNSVDSINNAAKIVAGSMIALYSNASNGTGLFASPYNPWESAFAFDSMVNYWALTGDTTYNSIVTDAMGSQRTLSARTNDAESFWALAAMTAAERGFPIAHDAFGTWSQLAETAFQVEADQWDAATCGGGLRWQYFSFNEGWTYKNSITNGNFVHLAARLALWTGNTTYLDWAQKVTQWSLDVGLISSEDGAVYDGTDTTTNCSTVNHIQWTASAGTYLSGAVFASNVSSTQFWNGIWLNIYTTANSTFAPDGILSETACQSSSSCDTDQLAYRSVLARALANMRDLTNDAPLTQGSGCTVNDTAPSAHCADVGSTHSNIDALLKSSAAAAAAQCSGGVNGTTCGFDWATTTWDGTQGLGQSLSALEILLALLPPVQRRNMNGTVPNTSTGNSSSSSNSSSGASASTTANSNIASSGSAFGVLAFLGFTVAFFL